MQQVVEDATSVHSFESDVRRTQGREQGKDKVKQKGYVHQHAFGTSGLSEAAEQKPADKFQCANCSKQGHRIKDCGEFRTLSIDNRWRRIRSLGVCQNCLFRHGRRSCRTVTRCGINGCQYRHHPLLHSSPRPSDSDAVTQVADNHTHRLQSSSVLFRIVPVTPYGNNGQVNTFAFLDEGSSLTLVEGKLVKELGISGSPQPLCLRWTANTSRTEKSSMSVSISISGEGKGRKHHIVGARTVESLNLPTQSFNLEEAVKRFAYLKYLPLQSYQNATPRILIGLDHLSLALPLKIREGDGSGPVAAKTRLGWCVYGQQQQQQSAYSFHICGCTHNEELHETLKQFFTVEEVGTVGPSLSTSDQRAQQLLEQTTKRVGDHFETGLLWDNDYIELPDSYPMALSRMKCLERRMERDLTLKEKVHQKIREYVSKDYAHVATDEELETADPRRVWYLPIGAVTNPRKPDKIRIIWDAAALVDGTSLNSHLLKGPDQLTALPAVLFKFRQFGIAVNADVQEMFHQLRMAARDKQSLRFLFRFDPTQPPIIYVMDVATFGATCSPASAQFVKNLNAKEHAQQYPQAAQRIVDNHYVDDYLDSFGDEKEAKKIAAEVRTIHLQGGFVLRNWNSNSKAILESLGEPGTNEGKNINLVDKQHTERVLGMLWMPATDELCFSTHMSEEIRALIESGTRPTKREVLRCVMTLFDPLGLLATFLIHGKVLIQELWRTGINWDEQIQDTELNRWREWVQMIQFISTIRIPRCYFEEATNSTYENAQLHAFVDASPAAYCCVVYLRVMNSAGSGVCVLVAAKTKVAPLKPMSIPRLELQGCALGARMLMFVQENHTIPITKRYLWTDNTTALSWIRADPRNYRPFVAHRVVEILETTNAKEWRYVPSASNPADEGTKWGKGPYFSTDSHWFSGPEFLQQPEDAWPISPAMPSVETEEIRASVLFHLAYEPVIQFERFSKWERLHCTVAYVLRFVNNISRERSKMSGEFQQEEFQAAEAVIMQQVQWQSFPDEMVILTKNKSVARGDMQPIPKSSYLFKLVPSLDENGVMRQTGRIGASKQASYNLRYPVILPKRSEITSLVVDLFHRKYKHANSETVVNEIRQQFEIPSLRTLVRRRRRDCWFCKLRQARPHIPPMGPLHASRLEAFSRPFSFSGLDYFGPVLVKQGRASVKRWVALFTCLTVRAVHLEVVNSLTTSSCISAVRRFIGRRGAPVEMFSDNGTNFHGAERLLRQQIATGLSETFTSSQCKWSFIPPGAPHMGGAWERMVQSVKAAMGDAYGDGKLDEEGLGTLVVEAESMVNSRPLTYLPLDSDETEALTPNHFLLGSSSGAKVPGKGIRHQQRKLQELWVDIQDQLDIFWKRWLKEYLPVIRRQPKWFEEAAKEITEGDLVLITNEGKRSEWIRGRVERAVRGSDGRVRQAIMRTAGGLVHRPVTKIALLDVKKDRWQEAPGGGCCRKSTDLLHPR
ncbi:uncharacterized protein LOC129761103 [Toxorhynchites rutilus septentrionalis]|uniref:uncharacterized protein LOC129761103 n=1 Tax=Toxorhynchites rutilus septentrionalis TaxID=329112 RepID=UPI00247A27D5|nr:uncharacterized protein LOC129761103 [Toxorhynchites rutilus septentrionalis]